MRTEADDSSRSTGGAVVANADGRLVFLLRPGRVVEHAWQTAPGGSWSALVDLPGQKVSGLGPIAIVNADGRIEVFRITDDSLIEHSWQLSAGGPWHAFEPRTTADAFR